MYVGFIFVCLFLCVAVVHFFYKGFDVFFLVCGVFCFVLTNTPPKSCVVLEVFFFLVCVWWLYVGLLFCLLVCFAFLLL